MASSDFELALRYLTWGGTRRSVRFSPALGTPSDRTPTLMESTLRYTIRETSLPAQLRCPGSVTRWLLWPCSPASLYDRLPSERPSTSGWSPSGLDGEGAPEPLAGMSVLIGWVILVRSKKGLSVGPGPYGLSRVPSRRPVTTSPTDPIAIR